MLKVGDSVRVLPECYQKHCGHDIDQAGHEGSVELLGKWLECCGEDDHPDNFDCAQVSGLYDAIACDCLEMINVPLPLPG